jgi:hypothetical protein
LSPATSKTARRCGSKMNRILISVFPADPGRSSFRLCKPEPVIRSTAGRPSAGPRSASNSTESRTRLALMLSKSHEPLVDLGHQDNLPAHTVIITCGLSLVALLDCDDEYKLTEMGRCRLFIRAVQAACRYSWRVPPSPVPSADIEVRDPLGIGNRFG